MLQVSKIISVNNLIKLINCLPDKHMKDKIYIKKDYTL